MLYGVRLFLCFLTEHIETEELGLILGVLTFEVSVGDLAAFDDLCETDQLAELALEVETVALIGYQKYITLTGVDHSEKFFYINIMKIYISHINYLLMFFMCFGLFVSSVAYYPHYSIDFLLVNRFLKKTGVFLGNLSEEKS